LYETYNNFRWGDWSVMITYIECDLFSSTAQVLVNPVNTAGVMGKGIALEFKSRYPEMFDAYRKNV
jgi:O-acetyl-ADP-ribose deacetylase (regulator of RNase III)